ncbi:Zinc finger CCCH domain-containing protein 56 [Nymphaea thermarum]|nr:Zinc finger CCCH domain-containing protein 56 [Nymphaea thermarum]
MSTPLPPPPPSLPPLLPSAGFWPEIPPSRQDLWSGESDYDNSFAFPEGPSKRPRTSSPDGLSPHDSRPFLPVNPPPKIPSPDSDSPSKNRGGSNNGSNNTLGGISRIFFKTKLCCKFRMGSCPYSSNCNFAHGNEELRKPPPNWQEIVANASASASSGNSGNDDDRQNVNGNGGGWGDRNKLRICKKFYNGEGCSYGDRCNFLHEDPGRSRESVAINVGLMGANGPDVTETIGDSNGSNQKPAYWKTRICNKWEMTGACPFGDKCHFAHGQAELQKYGGGYTDSENGCSGVVPSKVANSTEEIAPSKKWACKQSNIQNRFAKWKGPEKINRIYADWIDDNE